MNELINNALNSIGIPVEYQDYTGSEQEYIRFFYLPPNDFQADDNELYQTIYIQVDIFTPYNPGDYANQVKKLLKQAGFKKNFEHEVYETDTKLYHYILRFYIIKEAN